MIIKNNPQSISIDAIVNTAIINDKVLEYIDIFMKEDKEDILEALIGALKIQNIYNKALEGKLSNKDIQIICNSNLVVYMYLLALNVKDVPIDVLAKSLVNSTNWEIAKYAYLFALNVKDAPLDILYKGVEYNRYYILKFMMLPDAPVDKLLDFALNHCSLIEIGYIVRNVKNVDLEKVICYCTK